MRNCESTAVGTRDLSETPGWRSKLPGPTTQLCLRHLVIGEFPVIGVLLKLRVIADRLYHLAGRVYDNVRPVDDDEMAALLGDNLLAILREGQQRIL